MNAGSAAPSSPERSPSAIELSTLRIEGGAFITMDAQRRIIDDGVLLIDGDRIAAVGARHELPGATSTDTIIDARRMAVLPGLIDCHAHAGHGLIKSLGADDSEAWYQACEAFYTRASTEAFWAAEASLAALERLKFGVTCGVSLFGGGDSILRTDDPVFAARHCEAVEAVGIRSMLAVGPCRPPFPRRFHRWEGRQFRTSDVSFDDQLATCATVISRWHGTGSGRIQICIVSPTIRTEHVNALRLDSSEFRELHYQSRAARDLSRRHGLLFTQDGHTRGSVQYAHEALDILGPDALLSHSTDLDEAEIAICAETNTRIAHNPSAIASIRGRCPVPELLDAGVTVGLGSDATAPDRSGDMFRHMQQCMHYHRRHFRDPGIIPPGKALEMVTIDAARALGMEHDIGSLEVGKKADLVLVDLCKPHLVPLHMPLYRIVYFANGSDVDTVIVDGRVLMRARKVLSVNEQEILDAAHCEAEYALERANLKHLTDMPDGLWGRSHY
jgi:cytosine/adenosine deaminase-related metal-dependent hydrolase